MLMIDDEVIQTSQKKEETEIAAKEKEKEADPKTMRWRLFIDPKYAGTGTSLHMTVPLDSLLDKSPSSFYFHLRPRLYELQEGKEETSAEEEAQEEGIDEEIAKKVVEERKKKKKVKRKKSSLSKIRRKRFGGEAEYDLDDPFIDDTEASKSYVSIFDLMAGRTANFDEDELDQESDKDEHNAPMEGKKEFDLLTGPKKQTMSSSLVRAEDFFVYQGPLQEKIEKEFCPPIERKNKKSTTNRTNLKKKKKVLGDKEEPKVKRVKQIHKEIDSKEEKSPKKIKRDLSKSKLTKKTPLDFTLSNTIFDTEATEELTKDDQTQIKQSIESSNSATSPTKLVKAKPHEAEKMIAYFNLESATEKFHLAASQVNFVAHVKFPAILREVLDHFLLALARSMPFRSFGQNQTEADPGAASCYTLSEADLAPISVCLPYSQSAFLRLVTRKVYPLILEAARTKLDKLYTTIQSQVADQIKDFNIGESNSTDQAFTQATFQFSSLLKQSIYDASRLEQDLLLLNNVLLANIKKNNDEASQQNEDSQQQQAVENKASISSNTPPLRIVSILSPSTSKMIYASIYKRGGFSTFVQEKTVEKTTEGSDNQTTALMTTIPLVNVSMISHECVLIKKRTERQTLRHIKEQQVKKKSVELGTEPT